ncbi:MAG: hypothetical protein DME34_00045 [Verrucomicrobia bacterium]|nr:MAG: hypothetical protein DME34_00045 [Verrucomicrobiota bacterium]
MAWVYILRGSTGRHYIGSAIDLHARFAQHLRGHTAKRSDLERNLRSSPKKKPRHFAKLGNWSGH